jgi:hypothetical protein
VTRRSQQGDQERLVDFRNMEIERETDRAIGVRNARGERVWLPKSEITIDNLTCPPTITVPEWLVDQRELEPEC